MRKLVFTCILITTTSLSCQRLDVFCQGCIDFEFNGETRKYILHLPSNLPQNAPLVFALHGYTGRAQGVDGVLNLNEIADLNGFAVCYPQGERDRNSVTHWNARLGISDEDDIGFLSALAITLQEAHGLDTARTYTCGISNGGFMSYTLITEAPHIFKAAGSVIGTMSGYNWENRDICVPTPLLQITGTADNVVPMDGSMNLDGGWGGAPHIHEVVDFWTELNQTDAADTILVSDITTAYHYENDSTSNDVWYYEIEGMNHTVPQGGSPGFSAGELIWEFFSQL